MTNDARTSRRRAGERLAPLTLETVSHGSLRVPAAEHVHLQFRRFAGCPVCNLHLRRFAHRYDEIRRAGLSTVAFFHSSQESLLAHQRELPFPLVADAERRLYRQFGVERSALSLAHPRALWAAARGLAAGVGNPLAGEGGPLGLPADFLIAPDGELVAVRYGAHADDQWEVDELLALVQAAQTRAAPSALSAARSG